MRKVLGSVLLAGISALFASCGGGSHPSLTGIRVQPSSVTAWPDQVFTAVGVYSDGTSGALDAQVSWSSEGWWVQVDVVDGTSTLQADAVCLDVAPVHGLWIPVVDPATIHATTTINGQTVSDTAVLYCYH